MTAKELYPHNLLIPSDTQQRPPAIQFDKAGNCETFWSVNVSIIIPAFNEERLLPATLRTVRNAAEAFTRRGWDHEIIVCDNNSTDATSAVAPAAGARGSANECGLRRR